jgi:hypothetical protein
MTATAPHPERNHPMTTTTLDYHDSMCLDELAAEACCGGRIVRRGDTYALHCEPPMSIEGAIDLDALNALQFVSRDEMRAALLAKLQGSPA